MGSKGRRADGTRRRESEKEMKITLEATPDELEGVAPEELLERITQALPRVVDSALSEVMSKGESASTPAEPHERVKGSKKNPKGSARSASSAESIKLSKQVIDSLKTKVEEHNEKVDEPWQRVTLAKLKAVYRRGSGAFSVSHRPSQTRASWSHARVNAFLKIARGGGNKKYTQDDDLLHEDHPRRKTKKSVDSMIKARGGEVDLVTEIAARMRDLYDSRLSLLRDDLERLVEDDS